MRQAGHINTRVLKTERDRICNNLRKTTQFLMPAVHFPTPPGEYDIYPTFNIGTGKVKLGFPALAQMIASHSQVIIDGYIGIIWDDFRQQLDKELKRLGVIANWIDVATAMLDEKLIESIIAPYLGEDDPLFGRLYPGSLADFFDPAQIHSLQPDPSYKVNILYGCGSALAGWKGLLVYVDIPKVEIQYRSRAGCVKNLGLKKIIPPKPQYKRFYYVDWVVLNKHKAKLLPNIDVIVDGQRPEEPAIAAAQDLRRALEKMSQNYFRVRPWFEPGPWGGRWILEHIRGISTDVPNYAWSYELIVPENGLIFASDNHLLEVSFDMLMYQEYLNVLGNYAERFKYEFPIRYDFLDTFDGGNLSIQCHPREEYIQQHFGESFTQDEAYYILDCKPGARVFLGFKEGIEPHEFRQALENSILYNQPVDIERFVNVEPSHKHDLFLIPGGTIHASGVNNLVLEISSTTYYYTFKMYDWLRLDLDGEPRALNIHRAFDNLYFERQGSVIKQEHIARPCLIACGNGWQLFHLPTHRNQFYDVHRLEFNTAVELQTDGSPQVMNLVEGKTVILETGNNLRQRFNYAETFVVPAAAETFRLISENNMPVKVVKTFLKKTAQ